MILSKRNVPKFIITINIIYALSEILLMTVYKTNFYFSWKTFTTFDLKIDRVMQTRIQQAFQNFSEFFKRLEQWKFAFDHKRLCLVGLKFSMNVYQCKKMLENFQKNLRNFPIVSYHHRP